MAKQVYPVRVDEEMKRKLEAVAKHERRKPSDFVRLLIEDAIAAYEKEHGPIELPSPTK
ncbi:hypothetical protein [Hymenobacter sediminis]|uniref:hypothetical protein n=1 Tax=Hymenobacter sediminis TaxID=2218621 RepID=UPI00139061C4|nr:hypothetical protein [Hymenobacter sediminis]